MSITIDLSPGVESRLEQEAKRLGIEKTALAMRYIEEHFGVKQNVDAKGSANAPSPS